MYDCLLQNPVNSMEWMEADIHLLAPFVSLAIDTRNFCQPLQRVKVVVLLTVVFVATANVAVLARSSHNLFNLNSLSVWSWLVCFLLNVLCTGLSSGE